MNPAAPVTSHLRGRSRRRAVSASYDAATLASSPWILRAPERASGRNLAALLRDSTDLNETRDMSFGPGRPIPRWQSLPSGELPAAKLREVRIGGPGGAQATAYALYGVDMKPLIVLLDGNRRLFAFVSPVQVTVAEAHAGAWPALRDLAVELDHELLARLAREATHRPAGPVYVKNVHVFDSVTGRRSDPTTIVVYGSRVVGVRPDATAPANASVIDGEGGTVLPASTTCTPTWMRGTAPTTWRPG